MQCLGFALVEMSSAGLNLSEALSAFQLFVTDEGHADDQVIGEVIGIAEDADPARAIAFNGWRKRSLRGRSRRPGRSWRRPRVLPISGWRGWWCATGRR